MAQMVLFSTFLHLLFIGVVLMSPFFKSKRVTYTPVYTVNLVSLPSMKKTVKPLAKTKPVVKAEPVVKSEPVMKAEPVVKPEPVEKAKPVDLLSGKKKSVALAKLKSLGENIEEEKPVQEKNEIEESDIPEMLAALDKIEKVENDSGLIDDREEKNDKILEELNKLEKEWADTKDSQSELEEKEKSKSLEQLEDLKKKWQDEAEKPQPYPADESGLNEALAKLTTSSVISISNHNVNATPPYLLTYFSLIKSKAMSEWKNPSGIEILSEKETNKKTVISFNIIRSGVIEDDKIHESSGNTVLDELALAAVKNSDPLPPLPPEYYDDYLRVFLDFNYTLK